MRFLALVLLVTTACTWGCGGEGVSEAQGADAGAEEGSDVFGGVKDAAIAGAGGNVAVDAGFAGDGTVIQIPAGFTAAQCKFTASAATIDGSAISTQVSINRETGEVICEKVVQPRVEIPPEVQSCTASYTIVCVK
jgi:hypothetical protein